jgi:hypothetical protein
VISSALHDGDLLLPDPPRGPPVAGPGNGVQNQGQNAPTEQPHHGRRAPPVAGPSNVFHNQNQPAPLAQPLHGGMGYHPGPPPASASHSTPATRGPRRLTSFGSLPVAYVTSVVLPLATPDYLSPLPPRTTLLVSLQPTLALQFPLLALLSLVTPGCLKPLPLRTSLLVSLQSTPALQLPSLAPTLMRAQLHVPVG